MAIITELFNGDGTTEDFTVSSTILSKSHVRCDFYYGSTGSKDDVDATDHFVPENEWDVLSATILFETAPANGYEVRITVSSDGSGLDAAPSIYTKVTSAYDEILALSAIVDEVVALESIHTELVSLESIKAKLESLFADKATLDSLFADKNTLDTLFAMKTKLDSIYADKTTLDSIYADKTALDSIYANLTDILASKLRAWEAEASAMTAESRASEPENTLCKIYTSNGDGTFSSVDSVYYSSLHYSAKAIAGKTIGVNSANTVLSASASGVLALATTPTQSFGTRTYTGNGTSKDIIMGIGDGANLITGDDSTFTSTVGNWTDNGLANLSIVSERLRITNNSTGYGGALLPARTVEIGKSYLIEYEMVAGTATFAQIQAGTTSGGVEYGYGKDTQVTLTATSTDLYLSAVVNNNGAGTYADIDNISVKEITNPIKSYDPNWVSGRAYLLANEQDAYCIHNYYIYKLLADVTSATTPDADPTNWEVVADGESVPWFNSNIRIKCRTLAHSHHDFSTLLGAEQALLTDSTAAEFTRANSLVSFNDGFSLSTAVETNQSSNTYVAWQEQYDTMTSGTTNQGKRYITASNAQSGKGMSIYVGSGTAGHEIPHWLGTKPDFNVAKKRSNIGNWCVYDSYSGATEYKFLDLNNANASDILYWNNTEPTDSVQTLGAGSGTNGLSEDYVAYFSSNRDNHTHAGMYQGRSTTVTLDFGLNMTQAGSRFIAKASSSTGAWVIADNIRGGTQAVFADLSNVEASNIEITFTTTGVIVGIPSGNTPNVDGVLFTFEATVPNYDKPNGGLDRPSGTTISYSEGKDDDTGKSNSIETSLSAVTAIALSEGMNYIYEDKGGSVGVTDVKPLKGLDRVSADKWGVESPSDATLKTTDKHNDYASATGSIIATSEQAGFEAYKQVDKATNTYWQASTGATNQEIVYALSEKRLFKSLGINYFHTGDKAIDISYSTDNGVTYTLDQNFATTGATSGTMYYTDILANTTSITHIKVAFTTYVGGTNAGLYELELNTEHPAGDFYDVAEGIMYSPTELVTNGTFDTADNWLLVAGWSISGGKAHVDNTGLGIGTRLYPTPSLVPVVGREYNVSFTVSNYVSGTLRLEFAGVTFDNIEADGIYNYSITAASTVQLRVFGNLTTIASIDNVSVIDKAGQPKSRVYLGECKAAGVQDIISDTELVTNGTFDTDTGWLKGTGWTISEGQAHQDGSNTTDQSVQQSITLEVGKKYVMSADITRTAGEWYFRISAISDAVMNINGYYEWEFIATLETTSVLFAARDDFIGSVDNISVREVLVENTPEIIPDTLVTYPVAHQDATSMEVHEDLVVHGGFDLGQTWVDETGNRLEGVPYKNETGKPIMVSIKFTNSNDNTTQYLYVDNVEVSRTSNSTAYYQGKTMFTIVPPNSIYRVVSGGVSTFNFWSEYK